MCSSDLINGKCSFDVVFATVGALGFQHALRQTEGDSVGGLILFTEALFKLILLNSFLLICVVLDVSLLSLMVHTEGES